MSLAPYAEYEDSGTTSLGNVPTHWRVVRLKQMATIQNGRDYKDVEAEMGGYPVFGSGGQFARATEYLHNGESVLLGRKGTIDRPLYINGPFWTADTMFYTVISSNTSAKYLYYCALTIRFDLYSTNTALPSMTQADLGGIHFAVPCLIEQEAIVAFLDRETSKIDALISEQEKLIALLAEKRQATVSHAVTKGLNPNVPMKDSGVEWFGEVPEHWTTAKIKQVSTFITSGPRGWSDFIDDSGDDIFLQSGDLNYELEILPYQAKRVKPPQGAEGIRTRLEVGDVVVCITGANTGRVAVVDSLPATTYINQHLSLIRPTTSKANPNYIALVLASDICQTYFEVRQYGLKDGLSLKNVADAPLPLPDIVEQSDIVSFVRKETSKLAALNVVASRGIALLKERRSALISAAVTGKIDVRQPVQLEQATTKVAA